MAGSILGNAVVRREDPDLLAGRGTYVDNLPIDGVLHLADLPARERVVASARQRLFSTRVGLRAVELARRRTGLRFRRRG